MEEQEWPIISVYSRKEAVEDGTQVLTDPKITKEAGFKFPVYLTRSVWNKYVEVPIEYEGIQNLEGRLWDILTMLRHAARGCESNIVEFKVSVTLSDKGDWTKYEKKCGKSRTQRLVTLLSEIGPNEYNDLSPVITVSLPNED